MGMCENPPIQMRQADADASKVELEAVNIPENIDSGDEIAT